MRELRLPDARHRPRGPAIVALLTALAVAAAGADDAETIAKRLANAGARPAAGGREARAHTLIKRVFARAGLKVEVQRFRVPGRGRSRNVIGVYDTPRRCLRIVMAHADTTAGAPGANDNASGVGVLAELAPRLERARPWCDVWLVAIGAEERIYTGSPDHLGALALVKRARRKRLRWALSLDEVGRGSTFWLRSNARAPRKGVEREILTRRIRWVRDEGTGNSDHREFQLAGLPAAKLGVAGDEPCRHMRCDRAGRLQAGALRRARIAVERAIGIK